MKRQKNPKKINKYLWYNQFWSLLICGVMLAKCCPPWLWWACPPTWLSALPVSLPSSPSPHQSSPASWTWMARASKERGEFGNKETEQSTSLEKKTFSFIFIHLSNFLLNFSSAFSFWAEVRLSASARLSTAMAKKTFRRMSDVRTQENKNSFTFIAKCTFSLNRNQWLMTFL